MKNSKLIVSALILLTFAAVSVYSQTQPQPSQTTDRQVRVILQRLERSFSKFGNSLNSSLVQARIDQTRPENDINTFESGFETAGHQFRGQFAGGLASVTDVERVLEQASRITAFMARNRLSRQVQNDWTLVKRDLNQLANAYGVTWEWNRQVPQATYLSGSLQMSDGDINKLILRLETGGDTFRTSLTEAFEHTGYDHTAGEGNMNNALRGLKKETDQLRIQFDARQPLTNYVHSLLNRAPPIDTYMRGNLLTSRVQNDWLTLRADIDTLAAAFHLSEIARKMRVPFGCTSSIYGIECQ